VASEYRYVCRFCFPQECDLFKRGECKGPAEAGEVDKVNVETLTYKEAAKIHKKLRW
jgi:hypothetical protein